MSTWLITGCSSGLGRALAEAVMGAGHNAVVTARSVTSVADLSDASPERVLAVALDVTKPEQVASAVQQAEERSWSTTQAMVTAPPSKKATMPTSAPCSKRTSSEPSR
jgi:NAD(P)-dependent dehydrogenase (short-subunit alcohol dehydrogenase family)